MVDGLACAEQDVPASGGLSHRILSDSVSGRRYSVLTNYCEGCGNMTGCMHHPVKAPFGRISSVGYLICSLARTKGRNGMVRANALSQRSSCCEDGKDLNL
jgi:hypothetical protein